VAPEPITTIFLPSVLISSGQRWMNDLALELRHVLPFRRVAFGMAVIALAHPEEICGEAQRFAGLLVRCLDGPQTGFARPARRIDAVVVADVFCEIVLFDHLAHIGADFVGGRDGRADPRLEAVAEGVEVAVGANARIFVGPPRSAKCLLLFQHDESGPGHLLGEVMGAADAGDAGADNQHVEMLDFLRGGNRTGGRGDVHAFQSLFERIGVSRKFCSDQSPHIQGDRAH
jgi:hypothetical protein